MPENEIRWNRVAFKKNKVWMAIQKDDSPLEENGKVLIKYQRDQDYEYWVHKNSIQPLDSLDSKANNSNKISRKETTKQHSKIEQTAGLQEDRSCADTICVYTDGASSGNPGPAGIGVLLCYEKHEKEISKYIGIATNNIAELEAIRVGLLEIKNTNLPVKVFTDSSYAYGVLVQGWKAKKNIELVDQIKRILPRFKNLKLLKVKGHAGHKGNEKADFLATSAIKTKAPKR
ncbi:MAG: ribonuclease HI [Desulfobacterales bacterium]|nr:ribonuclease HI [Desulfobacterales bacterium]